MNNNVITFPGNHNDKKDLNIILPPTDLEFVLSDLEFTEENDCDGILPILECVDDNIRKVLNEINIKNICMHYDPFEIITILEDPDTLFESAFLTLTGSIDETTYRMINLIHINDLNGFNDNDADTEIEIQTMINRYTKTKHERFFPETNSWDPLTTNEETLLALYNEDGSAASDAIGAISEDLHCPVEILNAARVVPLLKKQSVLFSLYDHISTIVDFQVTAYAPNGKSSLFLSLTSADPSRVGAAVIQENNQLSLYQCLFIDDVVDAFNDAHFSNEEYYQTMASALQSKCETAKSAYLLWHKAFSTSDINKMAQCLIKMWDHYTAEPLMFTIPLSSRTAISTSQPFSYNVEENMSLKNFTNTEFKNLKLVQDIFCINNNN